MARDDIHIVGIADNTLYYFLYCAGTDSLNFVENVYAQESNYNDVGTIADVCCAAEGPYVLHVLLASNTGLWHTCRSFPKNADPSWQPFFGYVNGQEANAAQAGTFSNIRAAATSAGDGVLHVVGDGNGGPWHTIRWSAGNWQPSYDFVQDSSPTLSSISDSACAADAHGNLYVLGFAYTTQGGFPQFNLTSRDSDGQWVPSTAWFPGPFAGVLSRLSLATDGRGNLSTIVVTDQCALYGALYFASKKQWGHGLATLAPNGEIPAGTDDPHDFLDASCAFLSNGDVVLLAIGSNSTITQGLFRTTYSMDTRTWQPWTCINAQMATPSLLGPFTRCGIGISTAS